MKHLNEYIAEAMCDAINAIVEAEEETTKDDTSKKQNDEEPKDDESSEEPKEDETPVDNPEDDKGSEAEIDPKLKERAEIKFTIWADDSERKEWIGDNDGYQKIEYIYKDKEKGITIDFLLGRKDGTWCLWAGKDGSVNYDDEPKYDLECTKFQDAIMNALDKIQELIEDVKENPKNWVQFYLKQ